MQINVNGQNYDKWEDVPAEVRQQLAATLPDADKNGVPDLFEGNLGGLPADAQAFTAFDHGQRPVRELGGRAAARDAAEAAAGLGWAAPSGARRPHLPPPGTPAAPGHARLAVAAPARSGDAQRRPDHRRGRPPVKKTLVEAALRRLAPLPSSSRSSAADSSCIPASTSASRPRRSRRPAPAAAGRARVDRARPPRVRRPSACTSFARRWAGLSAYAARPRSTSRSAMRCTPAWSGPCRGRCPTRSAARPARRRGPATRRR